MKNGKRLTKKEKILLKSEGYSPLDYLRTKRTPEVISFVHRETGKEIEFRY